MENKENLKEELGENVRAFIDLDATGAAKGGIFLRSDLVEHVEKIEKDGKMKVVGIVYDGTYNLEIVCQEVGKEEAMKISNPVPFMK
tara:strand:+ start:38 stop:298 length:261 start_codon:yes stop_codon:yes gene_type:complete